MAYDPNYNDVYQSIYEKYNTGERFLSQGVQYDPAQTAAYAEGKTYYDIFNAATAQGFKIDPKTSTLADAKSYLQSKGLLESTVASAGYLGEARKYGYSGPDDLQAARQFIDAYKSAATQAGTAGIDTSGKTLQQISQEVSTNPEKSAAFNNVAETTDRTAATVQAEKDAQRAEYEAIQNAAPAGVSSTSRAKGDYNTPAEGFAQRNPDKVSQKKEPAQAQDISGSGYVPGQSLDIITDPVTGRSYARDLSIPGSTYKPYSGVTPAPAESISPRKQPGVADTYLGAYGYRVDENMADMFKIAPAKSYEQVYSSIVKELGLPNVKKQRESMIKNIGKLDQELADKIADVNENPWLTEGVRVREIQKLQDRYDLKKAPFAENLTLLEKLYSDGQEEARYVATQTLQQYNEERQFQLDQIEFMSERAEKSLDAEIKLMELANKGPDYGPGSIGEYQFAVSQGYQGTYIDYQNEDANRKARAVNAGLSPYQTNQAFLNITTRLQNDPFIKTALQGQTAVQIADQIIANPRAATNQLKSLYALVKNLDPDSAVREGELELANRAQSYLSQWGNTLTRVSEGRIIDPKTAVELANATKELATAWNSTAAIRQQYYAAQAQVSGVGQQYQQYVDIAGSGTTGPGATNTNDPLGIR